MKKLKQLLLILMLCIAVIFSGIESPLSKMCQAAEAKASIKDNEFVEDDYNVIVEVQEEWFDYYSAIIIIKNDGENAIENWELSFELDGEITNIWDAEIEKHDGNTYLINNKKWNQDIKPNQSIQFGITVKYNEEMNIPQNFNMTKVCKIVDVVYDVKYTIHNQWNNNRISGTICISNNSDKTIEDWKLSFNTKLNITSIWNANIESHKDETVYINNSDFNSDIRPNTNVKIGFTAEYTDDVAIENFVLYTMETYMEDTSDSDNDGLIDYYEENISFTDKNNMDTDNDGLSDKYELMYLNTDPLNPDSDSNGINDNMEDIDGDGLINIDEQEYNTDPFSDDTDSDGISDYNEIFVYNTNPLLEDTDSDGISDYSEIKMGLNPLMKDSDENGIIDSSEIIKQYVALDTSDDHYIDNIIICSEMPGDIEEHIEVGINRENTFGVKDLVSCIYSIENDCNSEMRISLKLKSLKQNINCNNFSLVEFIDNDFKIINTEFDENEYTLSFVTNSNLSYYGIVSSQLYEMENSKSSIITKKSATSKSNKEKILRNSLKQQVKEDLGNKAVTKKYSTNEAIDKILKYDKTISSASASWGVNKALIQALLLRELTCYNVLDDVADAAVMNYYVYKQQLEDYMKMDWLRQVLVGTPTPVLPQREDSSTGLGQIFAKTGMSARNYCLTKSEKKFSYSNWKERRIVWYNLKDNDGYNIITIAKILKMEAKGINKINLQSPSTSDAKLLLTRYNNGGTNTVGGMEKCAIDITKSLKNIINKKEFANDRKIKVFSN